MTAVQLPLRARPHRNQQLFSDYYLDVLLPERSEWRQAEAYAARLLPAVAGIYSAFVPSTIEAQTERDLVWPILELLGHTFEIRPALRVPHTTNRPDYVFYRDAAAVAANKGLVLDETNLQNALAVGDAKYWDRPLDRAIKVGSDPLDNKNPSYQISFYIQQSGLPWGILTNGRLWRLYHSSSAHKLDRFYEVDLVALLERGDAKAFQYFTGFFGRTAFSDGPLSLESLRAASTSFAQGVSDGLKAQVYDALRHVAQGFLDLPANGLDTEPATLTAIYDNALILLYRLLFILYAEARGLLPLPTNTLYQQRYSLDALKQELAQTLSQPMLRTSVRYWPTLLDLFRLINEGEPQLGVSTFNGGLFEPDRHPFLTRYAVGDQHLRQAIDKLARVKERFIDYRDLAEQHLGTIYEGLLEYRLQPLETPAAGWTVELVASNGERKASGSYYTPTFITRYMVEETVGPAVTTALDRSAADGPAAQVGAVLGLKVLDCSMGSGHFLVEATEYIARRFVEAGLLPLALWESARATVAGSTFSELEYWKRRVAQTCIYGVDINPLAVDLAKLSLWLSTAAAGRPLSFLDHHLRPGNSLVGARLSDLGLAPDRASDQRRARAAKKTEAQQAAGQLSMLTDDAFRHSVGVAVNSMVEIEGSPAATIDDVHAQEAAYERLRTALIAGYGQVADLSTATRFGVSVEPALWQPLADYAMGRSLTAPRRFADWLAETDRVAQQWRFFHWELEFPEVFFDRDGRVLGDQAGFDVVIGNPPYVRQEGLAPLKPYFEHAYSETYNGVADLYVYFFNQGLRLTHPGGRMSYIVTNKWLRAGYGAPLRGYFARQGAVEQLIDFGHAPIFPDADVFPCIIVLEKPAVVSPNGPPPERQVQVTSFPRELLHQVTLERYVAEHGHTVPHRRFTAAPWNLESNAVDELLLKIRSTGIPLNTFIGARPLAGIKTGFNDAFLIDTQARNALVQAYPGLTDHIRPYLSGRDVKRWSPSWAGLWILLLRSSGDYAWPWHQLQEQDAEDALAKTFPLLYEHLMKWEIRLKNRSDKGRFWWELRSCAYYDAFDKTNIFYQDLAFHSRFCRAESGTIAEMTCFCLPARDLWLLAVLNSPTMWAYMWRNVIHGKDEVLRLKTIYIEALPIAPLSESVRAEVVPAVERLIAITRTDQEARRITLDWLRTEFSVETPGQKLGAFASLTADMFVDEVRKRRPRAVGRLGPGALSELRAGYLEQATPVQQRRFEALMLERRLSELVNQAYGLTPEEVQLLWATAPPRMPLTKLEASEL
ncbi:MAG TPA: Eco57I restriction-modification methylase domain-containing protein [Ktedonobacterales bacterium]|nr:Eco57I restriction-modification methylase domain-containing protein [Ktedonobacterales bacterium]